MGGENKEPKGGDNMSALFKVGGFSVQVDITSDKYLKIVHKLLNGEDNASKVDKHVKNLIEYFHEKCSIGQPYEGKEVKRVTVISGKRNEKFKL